MNNILIVAIGGTILFLCGFVISHILDSKRILDLEHDLASEIRWAQYYFELWQKPENNDNG